MLVIIIFCKRGVWQRKAWICGNWQGDMHALQVQVNKCGSGREAVNVGMAEGER
jgi:hypothetical protein